MVKGNTILKQHQISHQANKAPVAYDLPTSSASDLLAINGTPGRNVNNTNTIAVTSPVKPNIFRECQQSIGADSS